MNTTLHIDGMHCQSCVKKLTAAFERVPGIRSAKVSLTPPRAEIEADTAVSPGALAEAARTAGNYTVTQGEPAAAPDNHENASHVHANAPGEPKPSLYPLALIVGFIMGTVALTTFVRGDGGWRGFGLDFMAGFFLVFSFFKLLDIRGFADAYQSYDIVARKSRPYALVYPFLELALGIAYLIRWQLAVTNFATLALMLVGSVGVLRAVLDKRRIRCACLGTALNLPMTTVTLVEDLGMAFMAAAALVWTH